MAVASVSAGGDFRIGDVMSRAWRLFIGNILFFLAVPFVIYVIVAVAVTVVILVSVFGFAGGRTLSPGLFGLVTGILVGIIVLGFQMVGQGVLLLGAFQRLRGQPLRIGEAVSRVMGRFFPLIGMVFLEIVALVAVTVIPIAILSGFAAFFGAWVRVLAFALVVPAAILILMWVVALPACVVERLGPVASMQRSAGLTRGARWKIFGVLCLLGLIALVFWVLQVLLARTGYGLAQLYGIVWFVLFNGFVNAAIIMIYHDLRVAKEGLDTEQIAAVFD